MGRNKIKPRQRVFLSTRMKIVVGTAVSLLGVFLLIIYFNFFDIKDTRAFSTGDYRTIGSGNWDDVSVWEVYDGENWSPAMEPPGDGVRKILVTNGQNLVMTEEIPLNQLTIDEGAGVSIESNTIKISKFKNEGGLTCNGSLDLGSSILEGNGDFMLGPTAVLRIGSDEGIDKKALAGNIQMTGKKEYHKEATYVFNGTVKQHTGNALPAVLKNLVIDNASGVILDQQLQVLDTLMLLKGVLATDRFTLLLGNSVLHTCALISKDGAISGNFNFWFGSQNASQLKFPLSDGATQLQMAFTSDLPKYQKGMVEMVYKEGVPDDSQKSPFEARQVVVAITDRGYFSAMLSNGSEEAWFKLNGVKETVSGKSEITWDLGKKADPVLVGVKPGGNLSGNEEKYKAISNVIYGPVPFKNQLVVRFYSDFKIATSLQLINAKGKVMQIENLQVEEGYNQFVFNADTMIPSGSYMIQISNPSEIHTFKVLCEAGQQFTGS